MKTLTLLTSGTNASAGLISSRSLPLNAVLHANPGDRIVEGEIRLDSGAELPASIAQAATGSTDLHPQVGLLLTVSHYTVCSSYPQLETGEAVNHLFINMGAVAV